MVFTSKYLSQAVHRAPFSMRRQMVFAPTSPLADGQGCIKTTYQECYFPGIAGSPGRHGVPGKMVKHGEIAYFKFVDGGSTMGSLSLYECQDGKLFSYIVTEPRER